MQNRDSQIQKFAVTSAQMRQIEERIFAAGMPVAALMEKVANLITRRLVEFLKPSQKVGVLVGSGHNGGDALVVARELHFRGFQVAVWHPLNKAKELTKQHLNYARSLGILVTPELNSIENCDIIIDGLFGFGLERPIQGDLGEAINEINQWSKPIYSIDIPSGLHTDTGEVLGTAIKATQTFCLGLWKLAFLQDQALEYIGKAELIDFDIPLADIEAILGKTPQIQRITSDFMRSSLPLTRPSVTHKYQQGHLLLICGSRKYAGGAILTALGARASGVGMLSVAVPESLKSILVSQVPEALIMGCSETKSGAIASFPKNFDLESYSVIACGPGLTTNAKASVDLVLRSPQPLILDADGLNILADLDPLPALKNRQSATILTPHAGEFKRLFPDLTPIRDRIQAATTAARQSHAIILLKGARTAIAHPSGLVQLIPESTPALARGGSGDVLTGLLGGLLAQGMNHQTPLEQIIAPAAAWHAHAGLLAAQDRTELGVDAFTLTQYLHQIPTK